MSWHGRGQAIGAMEGEGVGTALLPLLKEAARRPLAACCLPWPLHNAGEQECWSEQAA